MGGVGRSVVVALGCGVYYDIITLPAGRYRKIHLSCNGIQCVNAEQDQTFPSDPRKCFMWLAQRSACRVDDCQPQCAQTSQHPYAQAHTCKQAIAPFGRQLIMFLRCRCVRRHMGLYPAGAQSVLRPPPSLSLSPSPPSPPL